MAPGKGLWSAMQGVLCLYKPADVSLSALKKSVGRRLVMDGNAAVGWPDIPLITVPEVEPHQQSGALVVTGLKEQPDYSVHPLVVGEAFRVEDLRLEEHSFMEPTTSGVCLLGVNDGCDELPDLLARGWTSQTLLGGVLGRETHKNELRSKVVYTADYDHVTRHKMVKLLTRIEAQYRRAAFDNADVDMQSAEAFEMARRGIPRARLPGSQLLYRLHLKTFNPPYFALEITHSDTTDAFLRAFIHELGVALGTTASCVHMSRRSVGPFGAMHALLEKQWTLQNMVRNMAMTRRGLAGVEASNVLEEREEWQEEKIVLDGIGMGKQGTDNAEEEDAMRLAWPREY